jgi:phage baseplate assembly protein W
MKEQAFLGVGWSFPPTFDKRAKAVAMVEEDEDIRQSLRIILTTTYGERIMRPEFGSNISKINFSALSSNVINDLRSYITQSVLAFEPRVTLNQIELDQTEVHDGKLKIKLDYTIRKINVRTNIVFPFYFKEGTNLTNE